MRNVTEVLIVLDKTNGACVGQHRKRIWEISY
jgi:hypothetical protein